MSFDWSAPIVGWPGALLDIDGRADDDVWIVGAAVGGRSTVLHLGRNGWRQVDIDLDVDLWAVHAHDDGSVLVAGDGGRILRLVGDEGEEIGPNTTARHTITGLTTIGATTWAVGGSGRRAGVLWRTTEDGWEQVRLPPELMRAPVGDVPAIVDVDVMDGDAAALTAEGEVLLAATAGEARRHDLAGHVATGLTVHGDRIFTVGPESPAVRHPQHDVGVRAFAGLGVDEGPNGRIWVVGEDASVSTSCVDGLGAPTAVDTSGLATTATLRSVWVAPSGSVWAVGGDLGPALNAGALIHGHPGGHATPPTLTAPPRLAPNREIAPTACPSGADGAQRTVTRVLNELALLAVRHQEPDPLTTARNLFHLHVALFDALLATSAQPIATPISGPVPDARGQDRDAVLATAGATILLDRYGAGPAGRPLRHCLRESLDLRTSGHDAPSPSANDQANDQANGLGHDIGLQVLAWAALDGFDHLSQTPTARLPPLIVGHGGTPTTDAARWQPLDVAPRHPLLDVPAYDGVQRQLGPHWGDLRRAALPDRSLVQLAPDLEGPPRELDETLVAEIVEVVVATREVGLTPASTRASTHSQHHTVIGTYEPDAAGSADDLGRAIAEYWEGGRGTATPPGHWNELAHVVADHPRRAAGWRSRAAIADRLVWDTLSLVTLNAALHDAAILAWDAKRWGNSARPITLVRWMGAQGQRSDPTQDSFHPDGLPLIDGVIELITEESSSPGARHEHLHLHGGEIAIHSWPGAPGDPAGRRSSASWIRAIDWVPYQADDFVTPPFPGWVSGHSTFSAAAAEVLEGITGSSRFPGGQTCHHVPAGIGLAFEYGPSQDVELCWSTFAEAARQAGHSRIYGGIHPAIDHRDGARLGTIAGRAALRWIDGLLVAPGREPDGSHHPAAESNGAPETSQEEDAEHPANSPRTRSEH